MSGDLKTLDPCTFTVKQKYAEHTKLTFGAVLNMEKNCTTQVNMVTKQNVQTKRTVSS